MKGGSPEIGEGGGISVIASRHVRHRYRIFQNFRPVGVVAKPVDERKKAGDGSEQLSRVGGRPTRIVGNTMAS
jgi:hypothetical protein